MLVKMRSVVVMAMIWLTAVVGVSFTSWFAIDRAGRDLTGEASRSMPTVTMHSALGTSTPAGTPSPTDEATSGPRVTDPLTAPPPLTPKVPSDSPKAPASPGPPAATASTAPPGASWQDRTVSVAGGQVSVRCTGVTIVLRIAQPEDGWRVEVGESTATKVEVSFRRGVEGDEVETKVSAVCAAGIPSFSAASDS